MPKLPRRWNLPDSQLDRDQWERLRASWTPERQWQKEVTDALTAYGWDWYADPDSTRKRPGELDIRAYRPGRFLCAELKTEVGALTREQRRAIFVLRQTPVCVYVWRPSDRDQVIGVLAQGEEGACLTHTPNWERYRWLTNPPDWMQWPQPRRRWGPPRRRPRPPR